MSLILVGSACERSEPPSSDLAPPPRQVHLLIWEEYLPDSTVEKFEAATGYQLVQHYFENTDDQVGLMMAHPHHYDLVAVSHSDLPVFIKRSLIQKLDQERLVGTDRYSPRFRAMPNDPENAYSLPYLWGGFAVGYRKDLITDPEPSLALFFDDDTPGKRLLFDESIDVISVVNTFIGRSIADFSSETLKRGAELFAAAPGASEIELQPSSTMIGSLASNEFVVAINYSGDIAAAAEDNPNVGYFLPREGTPLWLDTLTVSRDSKNLAGAYAFLNFLMEPENIAEVSNEVWYPNAIPESYPLICEELRSDAALFPPEDVVVRSQWCTSPVGEDVKRAALFFRTVRKGRTPSVGDKVVHLEDR